MRPFARRSPGILPTLGRLAVLSALTMSWLATPVGIAAADAPAACASATTHTRNAWISDTISSATDVDWFRFKTTSAARTIVTLGHLAADYDLELWSGCSTRLATARRGGAAFDEILTWLIPGTYSVRVVGYAGAHSATTYALRFRQIPWGVRVLSSSARTDAAGTLHIVGEVINNTGDPRRWIEIDATLKSGTGAILGSAIGYADVGTLRPLARSPFEITVHKPSGYASASLSVCTPSASGCQSGQVTTAPLAGLTVTPGPTTVNTSGRQRYTGSVGNGGGTTAYVTESIITEYDTYGSVRGIAIASTTPSTIPAGGRGTYVATGTSTTAPNRVASVADASRIGCSTSPRYATTSQENLVPPIARSSAGGRVALTFDMGGRMTPAVQILRTLVANRVCATLFPTGAISRTTQGQAALAIVAAHPELFELGNHTMHHCDLVRGGGGSPSAADAAFCRGLAPSPTQAEVQKELIDGERWIHEYSGMTARPFWRAPYASYNANVLKWAALAGYTKHIEWDIDTIDWKPISDGGPTALAITRKVVDRARSGSVVLMHLGGYETPNALQAMIDGLRSRGFTLTTISDIAQ